MKNRRALTLVELLVVLAVMATLFALAAGAVQAARRTADRLLCASNLHQIGVAMEMYRDIHGRFPLAVSFPVLPEDVTFATMIEPLIESEATVVHCPGDRVHAHHLGISYEYNQERLAGKSWQEAMSSSAGSPFVWVLWDADPFHAAPYSGHARNILHADGHVSR